VRPTREVVTGRTRVGTSRAGGRSRARDLHNVHLPVDKNSKFGLGVQRLP